MKSWPTLVPLRHARFYAPKEVVFVTCCHLACKGGVFCCANDNTVFGFNTLPASWTLKLTEIWGESKNNFGKGHHPFVVQTIKPTVRVRFLGKPKNGFVISDHTDSSLPKKRKIRKRIIFHDNSMSSCSSWQKKQNNNNSNNKLILTAKTRRKSSMSYKWIYEMYIFRFETKTFLE